MEIISPISALQLLPVRSAPILDADSVFPETQNVVNETNQQNLSRAETIQQVGQDFESIFFSMLLKEMRKSLANDDGGGLFPGDKSDAFGSLFDLYLGQHLATSKQLGIGQAISAYMANQAASP
ncbi:MAG TPA: hypothetical protein PKD64_01840 [Pirellulaceae bacterium]|nr:hypothetical protein [Pirellulaceae bacterium]HMO90912.1 hypothetical protein [Pirellulaceae bacterium]HMP68612.1 hypothetical protein [Pirellulaceae bacterium]